MPRPTRAAASVVTAVTPPSSVWTPVAGRVSTPVSVSLSSSSGLERRRWVLAAPVDTPAGYVSMIQAMPGAEEGGGRAPSPTPLTGDPRREATRHALRRWAESIRLARLGFGACDFTKDQCRDVVEAYAARRVAVADFMTKMAAPHCRAVTAGRDGNTFRRLLRAFAGVSTCAPGGLLALPGSMLRLLEQQQSGLAADLAAYLLATRHHVRVEVFLRAVPALLARPAFVASADAQATAYIAATLAKAMGPRWIAECGVGVRAGSGHESTESQGTHKNNQRTPPHKNQPQREPPRGDGFTLPFAVFVDLAAVVAARARQVGGGGGGHAGNGSGDSAPPAGPVRGRRPTVGDVTDGRAEGARGTEPSSGVGRDDSGSPPPHGGHAAPVPPTSAPECTAAAHARGPPAGAGGRVCPLPAVDVLLDEALAAGRPVPLSRPVRAVAPMPLPRDRAAVGARETPANPALLVGGDATAAAMTQQDLALSVLRLLGEVGARARELLLAPVGDGAPPSDGRNRRLAHYLRSCGVRFMRIAASWVADGGLEWAMPPSSHDGDAAKPRAAGTPGSEAAHTDVGAATPAAGKAGKKPKAAVAVALLTVRDLADVMVSGALLRVGYGAGGLAPVYLPEWGWREDMLRGVRAPETCVDGAGAVPVAGDAARPASNGVAATGDVPHAPEGVGKKGGGAASGGAAQATTAPPACTWDTTVRALAATTLAARHQRKIPYPKTVENASAIRCVWGLVVMSYRDVAVCASLLKGSRYAELDLPSIVQAVWVWSVLDHDYLRATVLQFFANTCTTLLRVIHTGKLRGPDAALLLWVMRRYRHEDALLETRLGVLGGHVAPMDRFPPPRAWVEHGSAEESLRGPSTNARLSKKAAR